MNLDMPWWKVCVWLMLYSTVCCCLISAAESTFSIVGRFKHNCSVLDTMINSMHAYSEL